MLIASSRAARKVARMKPILLALAAIACTHARQPKLPSIKAETMSADYRADLPALARLRDEAAAISGDDYLATYWSAYASWRIAINGANSKMGNADLRANLEAALRGFDKCIAQRGDFADAYAAEASVLGWLAALEKPGSPELIARVTRMRDQLVKAKQLAPDNPRVLWVVGGVYLYAPPDKGGDKNRALQTYQRMVEAAQAAGTSASSPLPDWGLPEAHMSLAYAHLNNTPPDLDAASREAREALRLEPDWSYVRDVLTPQIEAARTGK
jgi:hypothetical protein